MYADTDGPRCINVSAARPTDRRNILHNFYILQLGLDNVCQCEQGFDLMSTPLNVHPKEPASTDGSADPISPVGVSAPTASASLGSQLDLAAAVEYVLQLDIRES